MRYFRTKCSKRWKSRPPNTILLLTALDRASLLPTIVSRCQVLDLRPLDHAAEVEAALRGRELAGCLREQADCYARLANGRLGWAVDQLADPHSSRQRLDQLQQLWDLLAADRVQRLAFAESLAQPTATAAKLFACWRLWTAWWRDVLLVQAGRRRMWMPAATSTRTPN